MGSITKKQFLIAFAVFVVLLCLTYLPKISHVGYLQDDWNVLFVAEQQGPGNLVFHYSIDRPLQGYLALVEYRLFHANLPAYLVLALVFRLLDTVILFLILGLVWPQKWRLNLMIAALVLIYPGFHETTHAFNYQVQYVSRLFLLLSILASLLPLKIQKLWQKAILIIMAILFAQVGYGLLDYQIGMEALRLALLAILFLQRGGFLRWWKDFLYAFLFIAGAGVFSYWRLFLFESKRQSVDAGAMLAGYGTPGQKILENLQDLGINLYRLVISAFYKPLTIFGKYMNGSDWLSGIVLALLAVGVIVIIAYRFLYKGPVTGNPQLRQYPLQLILVGLIGSIGALAPIIFGGRELLYGITGDRYSYPGSISACILIAGLVWLLRPRGLRTGIIAVLVFLSVLTQFSNNVIFAHNGDQTREVWWQMSWRAPQISPTTLLTGRIHLGILDEDYTLWGPANLIYYPGNREVMITAEVLDESTLPILLAGEKVVAERKGIAFEKDFANLLVLSKTENTCLHIIDGLYPEYSTGDDDIIREVGSFSKLERIDSGSGLAFTPRQDLFGREPVHDWCYYYQKAQLARQQRNWQEVTQLGEDALAAGYAPSDPMEWLVFLQGFAYTRNSHFYQVLDTVKSDAYSHVQACGVFNSYSVEMEGTGIEEFHQNLLQSVCIAGN